MAFEAAAAYPMDETHLIAQAVYELGFETCRRCHQHSSFWRHLSIRGRFFFKQLKPFIRDL
jgi:hypothetical protein